MMIHMYVRSLRRISLSTTLEHLDQRCVFSSARSASTAHVRGSIVGGHISDAGFRRVRC